MRYLVTARVKQGREVALREAIERGTLGHGSVAGDEYLRNMAEARWYTDGSIKWVEICFCDVPLQEERPYWEEYFDLVRVQDAHGRHQKVKLVCMKAPLIDVRSRRSYLRNSNLSAAKLLMS